MIDARRKQARAALAEIITAHAPSIETVYAYQATALGGHSPVVCVTSAGTKRVPTTLQGSLPSFALDIHVFVLYSDVASGWTPQDAEDTLDQVEEEIGLLVDTYRRSTAWQRIAYLERSDARTPVVLEGRTYLHELIPVEIQTYQ